MGIRRAASLPQDALDSLLPTERQLHDAAADLFGLSRAHRELVAEEQRLAGLS